MLTAYYLGRRKIVGFWDAGLRVRGEPQGGREKKVERGERCHGVGESHLDGLPSHLLQSNADLVLKAQTTG